MARRRQLGLDHETHPQERHTLTKHLRSGVIPDAIAALTNTKGWGGYLGFVRRVYDVVERYTEF